MPNLNELMLAYREGARGLWNHLLREGADFDRVDAFAAIRALLLDEVVLRPFGKSGFKKAGATEPYPFLRVVPTVDPLPVQVNRPSLDHNMYWDDAVESLSANGLSLQLIDFYDWDDFGYIDLRYYRVKVAACAEHPELLGRQALIEVGHANVEFQENGTSPTA